ncbi:MAG: hypothetical protein P4L36_06665 [Holophaga sp.]|nr:hypothetical protein [Holophaga sp.]
MFKDAFGPPGHIKTNSSQSPFAKARRIWVALGLVGFVGAMGCIQQSGTGTPSGFTLAASPNGLQIPAGGSGYAQVAATRTGGFTGAITLALANLPVGVVASGSIPAGAASGRLTVVVDGSVGSQSLGTLALLGQCGTLQSSTGFSLTVAAALPVSTLPTAQVHAPGGAQSGGAWRNTGMAMEPVAHSPASNSSGTIQNRPGFLPDPSPSAP